MKKPQPKRTPTQTYAIINGEGTTERILGETIVKEWAERDLKILIGMGYKDARLVQMNLEEATAIIRRQEAARKLSKSVDSSVIGNGTHTADRK